MVPLTEFFILLTFMLILTGLAVSGMIPGYWSFGILLIGVLGFFSICLFRFGRWIANARCPQCGQLFSKKTTHSTTLGIFKKYSASIGFPEPDDQDIGIGDLAPPHLTGRPHLKLKVHYQCDHCGFEWDAIQLERLS